MSDDPNKLTLYYIRVSTLDQVGGAESQTRALMEWGSKNGITNYEVFADHGISGAKESRPALNRLMDRVKEGNTSQVVCFAFSRFARSTTHLLRGLEFFKSHSVRFVSITECLDTNSPMGVCLFTILGCLAQLERELIRERVIAGLKNARAKGKIIGRVRRRNDLLIHSLLDAGMSFRAIAKIANCSHGSVSASLAALSQERIDAIQKARIEHRMKKRFLKTDPSMVVLLASRIVPDEASSSAQTDA